MLSDIDLFITLVRAGSLAKAGKILDMPASTVSRRLQAFEKRIGTTLFFRSTKSLRCTCDGECLYAICKDSVDQLRQALSSVQNERIGLIGKVRIQVPSSIFEWTKSSALKTLLDTSPGIRIEIMVSDQEPDLILEGIDLLIHIGELKNTGCVTKKLFDTELALFASPLYLESHSIVNKPEQLKEHEVLHHSCQAECRLYDHDGTPVHVRVHERLVTKSSMVLLHATLSGLGIGLLPSQLAQRHVESGSLIKVLPNLTTQGRPVYITYLNSRSLSACARAVLETTLSNTGSLAGEDSNFNSPGNYQSL